MPAHSKYDPKFATQAEAICTLGATEPEVAEILGVARMTLWTWKREHPEFAQAMRVGKEAADERVVQSLYRTATGYSFDAEEVFCVNGDVTRVPVVKHVPPHPTAMIFWLKNRKPGDWRDVKAVEHSGAIKHSHVEELSDVELERIAAGGRAGIAKKANGSKKPSAVH